MSLRRISVQIPSGIYFVTTSTIDHERAFVTSQMLWKLHGILGNLIVKYDAKLYGYVFMPSHVHFLLRIPSGVKGLSTLMRDFKSLSSRQLLPERHGIWMHGFDEVTIVSEKQFLAKLNYIHTNPVRAGLVREAKEYFFSSAAVWEGFREDTLIECSLNT